jgi:hypothetical protein
MQDFVVLAVAAVGHDARVTMCDAAMKRLRAERVRLSEHGPGSSRQAVDDALPVLGALTPDLSNAFPWG